MYIQSVKYGREIIICFTEVLIEKVGKYQVPVMYSYTFHKVVQSWFNEQSKFRKNANLPNLYKDF